MMKRWGKFMISLMGLSVHALLDGGQSRSATLTQPLNFEISNDFPTISSAFQDSTDLLLSSVPNSSIVLSDSEKSLQVMLLSEKLNQLQGDQQIGNFAETFNSLKKVEWLSVVEKATSFPVSMGDEGTYNYNDNPITNDNNSNDKVAVTKNKFAPTTINRSVQNYLSFLNKQTSPGEGVNLLGYRYNNQRTGLSLSGTGLTQMLASMSNEQDVHTQGVITKPSVRDGVKLDRPTATAPKFQSALQLWPRNILASQVKGYGDESGNLSETMKNFGTVDVTVNYKTMPEEILKTSLDLEVNWVDRGQYSENLRQTNLAILDIYRSRNEQFQQTVEKNRQKWIGGQQAYQQKVNSQMSQSFNSIQKQPSLPRSYSNLRGQASKIPARYR